MKRAFLCNVRESSASRASVRQAWLEGGNATTTVCVARTCSLTASWFCAFTANSDKQMQKLAQNAPAQLSEHLSSLS